MMMMMMMMTVTISMFKKKNVTLVLLKIHTSAVREILNICRPETQTVIAQAYGYFLWGFKADNLLFLTRIRLPDFWTSPQLAVFAKFGFYK